MKKQRTYRSKPADAEESEEETVQLPEKAKRKRSGLLARPTQQKQGQEGEGEQEVKRVEERFMHPTNLVDVDKHMMAYIDSKMAASGK